MLTARFPSHREASLEGAFAGPLLPAVGTDTYLLSTTLLPTTNRFHPLGYLAWNVPLRLPPVKIPAQRTNP